MATMIALARTERLAPLPAAVRANATLGQGEEGRAAALRSHQLPRPRRRPHAVKRAKKRRRRRT
eukprot:2464989-Pyramimonas_sp.AAC.1